MICVYAVCRSAALLAMAPELHSHEMRGVEFGDLAAIVGDAPSEPGAPSERELWEHEDAVEALMRSGELLPVRYGTVIDREESVAELLAPRAPELARALHGVRGRVELAVRARFSPQLVSEGDRREDQETRGRDYMTELRTRRRLAETLASRIDRDLGALASASRKRTLPTATQPMSGAYLVEQDAVARFRDRVQELDAEIAEAEIACTGPWPPYSFTDERDGHES